MHKRNGSRQPQPTHGSTGHPTLRRGRLGRSRSIPRLGRSAASAPCWRRRPGGLPPARSSGWWPRRSSTRPTACSRGRRRQGGTCRTSTARGSTTSSTTSRTSSCRSFCCIAPASCRRRGASPSPRSSCSAAPTALPRPTPRPMTTSSPAFRLTGISWRCICSRRNCLRRVNAAILLALSALVFVRIGYVYPTRTPELRGLTIGLGAVWGTMVLAIILMMPEVPRLLLLVSLFFPVYYTVLSLVLHGRRRPAPEDGDTSVVAAAARPGRSRSSSWRWSSSPRSR